MPRRDFDGERLLGRWFGRGLPRVVQVHRVVMAEPGQGQLPASGLRQVDVRGAGAAGDLPLDREFAPAR